MKRSKFNLSRYHLSSFDMGQLVPIGLTEVLPGDTIQHATSALLRAMPLATPPMHNVLARVHHWYVPHRVVFPEFEPFITGGPDGMDATVFPTINLSTVAEKSLADYLGIPPGFAGEVSALPFRVYAKVWNENYRDQDLQTPLAISDGAGPDSTTSTSLQNCCWEKDYFTTARPWEQKGPTVTLPLGVSAPVRTAASDTISGAHPALRHLVTDGSVAPTNAALSLGSAFGALGWTGATGAQNGSVFPSNLYADLTGASAVDVNDVREAFALQRYQEARARYGSRYTEYLAYLGVRSSDARLQRPEYLGGGRQSLQFSEVLQTGSTAAAGDGVGQLYGHGIAGMRSNRYRKFFEEHGYIMSVIYVLPKTIYPQGISRTWNRRVKEDFWQKELQHIGQQQVLMKELYALGAGPDTVFGYQDRYDEYRRAESTVHGEFRTSLNDWHFARLLSSQPTLNASFVSANPAKRPFQAQGENNTILCAAQHQMVARRMVAASGSSFIF